MWWIFKRRENKKWEHLHEGLKKSFSSVREDITIMFNHIDIHKKETQEIFNTINQRLERLENAMMQKPEIKIDQKEETTVFEPKETEWNSLTNKQQGILHTLGKLQNEGLKGWVSLKELVEETDPNKEYDKIRPLISTYLGVLIEYGMVKRKRRGKQTYISITSKGFSYQQTYTKTKKLLKLINDKN